MKRPRFLVVLAASGGLLLACAVCGVVVGPDREASGPITPTAMAAMKPTAKPTPVATATSKPIVQATPAMATISARDEYGDLLPGGMVNIWDNYQTKGRMVTRCSDGERVEILRRSGDGVQIETSGDLRGWVSYWFIRELQPTSTPHREPPPAVQLYALTTGSKAQTMAEALGTLSELLTEPHYREAAWTLRVGAQVAIIKRTCAEILAIEDVPAEMAPIHAVLVAATTDYDDSMDHFVKGVDNLDANQIEIAVQLMYTGGEKMGKVTAMLETYQAQFDE